MLHERVARWLLVIGAMIASGCAANPKTEIDPDRMACTYDHGAVTRGDRTQKRLALVFTGGDYGEGAAHILDVLKRRGARAAFFLTGGYIARPEHRNHVRRMVAEGHYVGPHSNAHLLYCPWDDRERSLVTEGEFRSDLERNIAALRSLGALQRGSPVLFMPPYEWFNHDHVRWAREMGVTLINFTRGSGSNRDYIPEGESGFAASAEIAADILACEQRDPNGLNGYLLLLHAGSLRTDKMHLQLEPLIDALQQRGYALVRVDELLR